MSDSRSGLDPDRLVGLMRAAIERCELDLGGAVVLTEAATGAYAVTPVLAAMAGAEKVFALTCDTRHGTVEQVAEETYRLAEGAGLDGPIEIVTEKTRNVLAQADIVTNSGHVRPIDAETVSWMKPTAVIPLMYEAWEFRAEDIDLEACASRGIPVMGTNERHPAVDVFSFLGTMAEKQLRDAGLEVRGSRVLLLCDNDFADYIRKGLAKAGAHVNHRRTLTPTDDTSDDANIDAVVVALRPGPEPVLGVEDVARVARASPGALIAQFWGDLDREALASAGLPVWPPEPPPLHHMGILPSDAGAEPVVRLQSGGLKVGQVLLRDRTGAGAESRPWLQRIE